MYIVTEYFSDVIHSYEQTNKQKRRDELRDVLARMKQMDELFKKTEKEHLETIAAMQKRIEQLEGTFYCFDACAFIFYFRLLLSFSFSVFGTCDKTLALVDDIKSQES